MKLNSTPVALALALAPMLVLGLSACTNGESTASKTTGPDKSVSSYDWDLAKAKCIRGEGIDYPDPSLDGKGEAPGIDDYDAFMAADSKCTESVTKTLGARLASDAEKKESDDAMKNGNKILDCLRRDGYDVPESDGAGVVFDSAIPESAYEKCGLASSSAESGS